MEMMIARISQTMNRANENGADHQQIEIGGRINAPENNRKCGEYGLRAWIKRGFC
jgi:hypothetical protein